MTEISAYVHPDDYDLGVSPLAPSSAVGKIEKALMSHLPYARGEFMTGIAAKHVDELLSRYIDLNWDYYDFSAKTRDAGLTLDANGSIVEDKAASAFVKAVSAAGCGLKDSTVTPDEAQAKAWGFKKPPSPNGVIRKEGLFAVIERPSIRQRSAHRYTIFRLPDGNMYSEAAMQTKGATDILTVVANPDAAFDLSKAGSMTIRQLGAWLISQGTAAVVLKLKEDTTLSTQPLNHARVRQYARACFERILLASKAGSPFDLVVVTGKYTIAKADAAFVNLCKETYESEFKSLFVQSGLADPTTLLSDALAAKMPAEAFAGKKVAIMANAYDGDWMSDLDNGLNYGPGFGASILIAPVSEKNPKGIYLPEITAGTATDLAMQYLKGGAARDDVKFNPAAVIDAKLKALSYDAATTNNAALAHIVNLARQAFFDNVIDDAGNLIYGTYDKTMYAWSAKLDDLLLKSASC